MSDVAISLLATREEALALAQQRLKEGYAIIGCDDPERGVRGYLASLVHDDQEVAEIYEWPLFQVPLEVDKATVSAEELASFLAAGPVSLCDDPKQLLLGFVRYEPEKGRAVVRQTKLVRLKPVEDDHKNAIMEARVRLLEEARLQREALPLELNR